MTLRQFLKEATVPDRYHDEKLSEADVKKLTEGNDTLTLERLQALFCYVKAKCYPDENIMKLKKNMPEDTEENRSFKMQVLTILEMKNYEDLKKLQKAIGDAFHFEDQMEGKDSGIDLEYFYKIA